MEAGCLVTVKTPDEFAKSAEPMVVAYLNAFAT
jgi:hypothetical protein